MEEKDKIYLGFTRDWNMWNIVLRFYSAQDSWQMDDAENFLLIKRLYKYGSVCDWTKEK